VGPRGRGGPGMCPWGFARRSSGGQKPPCALRPEPGNNLQRARGCMKGVSRGSWYRALTRSTRPHPLVDRR